MLGYRPPAYRLFAVACAAAALAGCASESHPSCVQKAVPLATVAAQAPAPTTSAPKAVTPKPVAVRAKAPFRYVVKPGDTLWGIAVRFLRSPWLWPEIWYENPYIVDPHLIYPGDVITLTYSHGQPVLSITRNGVLIATTSEEMKTRFVKPTVQRTPLAHAIPTIPYDEISALLSKPRVMSEDQYLDAPYVLQPANSEELLAAAPYQVYARGIPSDRDSIGTQFSIVHKVKELKDPSGWCTLGYEVSYLGQGVVMASGDPTTLKLQSSTQEIAAGDRLVPVETGVVPSQFPLLTPKFFINADIIDVIGGLGEVGQYQVVVLDQGSQSGLRMGDVLDVYKHGTVVSDKYANGKRSPDVRLPNRRTGELLVFRVYPQVAFGLVLHAVRPVAIDDLATNP